MNAVSKWSCFYLFIIDLFSYGFNPLDCVASNDTRMVME